MTKIAALVAALAVLAGCGTSGGVATLRLTSPSSATSPPTSSCMVRWENSEPLPDPSCTPGQVITSDKATVCTPGYSNAHRFSKVAAAIAKTRLMARYGIPESMRSVYELDHLIPVSLGGSNADANLWPEPNHDAMRARRSTYVLNDKDALESRMKRRVCSGRVAIADAQHGFSTDWTQIQ